jgi:hypothetical protein
MGVLSENIVIWHGAFGLQMCAEEREAVAVIHLDVHIGKPAAHAIATTAQEKVFIRV